MLRISYAMSACGALLALYLAQNQMGTPRPNILLISVDTLRRDHLGCYGYSRDTSPNIDALAKNGTRFTNFNSNSCWTLPAHATLFTGRYAPFHGLRDEGVKLSPKIPTLAEQLQKAGYWTLGVVSHVYISSEFGLEKGFETFDDSLIEKGKENPIAERTVDRLLQHMEKANPGERPFFACIHLFDPHWDYEPPQPFNRRYIDPGYQGPIDGRTTTFMRYWNEDKEMPPDDLRRVIDLYDGEIAYVDSEIGRLIGELRKRGLMENTVVVFTADHGEEFKDHGKLGHARTLYVEQVGVPCIISGHSSFPPGTTRGDLTSMVDLAPTILSLAGAAPLSGIQGLSLVKSETPPDRLIYGGSIRWGTEVRMVINATHKLIHYLETDQRLLYDVRQDPFEKTPLSNDPAGLPLIFALEDYNEIADAGWHLKLISLDVQDVIRCYGTVRTEGRLVNPRRYISDQKNKQTVVIHQFDVNPNGKALNFDIELHNMIGRVSFEVEPRDAPVEFDIEIVSMKEKAGVFVGPTSPLKNGEAVVLERRDPRLSEDFRTFTNKQGCFIVAVTPDDEAGPKTQLTPEALNRLRSLGYLGGEKTGKP